MKASEINIRDPFVLVVPDEGLYYMYGTRGPEYGIHVPVLMFI